MKMVNGNVLIKPLEQEQTTQNGIILPGKNEEKCLIGEVVDVPKFVRTPTGSLSDCAVSKGDTVIYDRYSREDYEIDGEMHHVVHERFIFSVIG